MDTISHKIENYWPLKHKTQDLIDAWVITIDLSNKRYKVSDQFEVHHVSLHNLPNYSLDNPFVIKNLGPCEEDL